MNDELIRRAACAVLHTAKHMRTVALRHNTVCLQLASIVY